MPTPIKIVIATFILLGAWIGLLFGGPVGLSILFGFIKLAAGG